MYVLHCTSIYYHMQSHAITCTHMQSHSDTKSLSRAVTWYIRTYVQHMHSHASPDKAERETGHGAECSNGNRWKDEPHKVVMVSRRILCGHICKQSNRQTGRQTDRLKGQQEETNTNMVLASIRMYLLFTE